jgi:RNAse (barnase) inhibitor barstar
MKICIDASQLGSAEERERLFASLLSLVADRVSGHAGGRPCPVIAFTRDDAICFGGGSRLHELARPVAAALEGPVAKEFVIDGSRFSTLEGFYEEIDRVLIRGANWGRNLDAFNDILRGGFGTPDEGFVLRWSQSETSRKELGYPETARQLKLRLARCHPSNRKEVAGKLALAESGEGQTVFDWLVEIIKKHGPGGREGSDNVHLALE